MSAAFSPFALVGLLFGSTNRRFRASVRFLKLPFIGQSNSFFNVPASRLPSFGPCASAFSSSSLSHRGAAPGSVLICQSASRRSPSI